jgi:hypothetical protein
MPRAERPADPLARALPAATAPPPGGRGWPVRRDGTDTAPPGVAQTVREVAKRYRVSPDRVRAWIKAGRLGAINTADARCARPRFVVLPDHLAAFERAHSAGPPPRPARRRKRTAVVDYYPD